MDRNGTLLLSFFISTSSPSAFSPLVLLSRKTFSNDGNMKSFNCFSPKLNLIDNSNFIFYACVNHLSFFFKFLLYFNVFTSLYSSSSGNHITDAWQHGWADGRSVCVTTNKFSRRKNNAIMRFFFSFRSCSRHFRIICVVVVFLRQNLPLLAIHFRESNSNDVPYVRIISIIFR